MFTQQIHALRHQYRIICPDFRGFGNTLWDKHPFSLCDLVDDVIRCLNELNIEQFYLAGMSMGDMWLNALPYATQTVSKD